MTTEELINRAHHAIRTNQPRLAQLYMRNALQQIDHHRRQLDPLGWQLRQLKAGMQAIEQGMQAMGQTIRKARDQIIEALRILHPIQPAPHRGDTQNDYALAAPQEG